MSNSSTSTASNNEMSSAGGHKSSTNGLHKFSLDLLIQYIENTLSAITNQGLDSKKMHSGTELKDLVQPLASDFSKLFQGISDGAKLFSDQSNFLKCRLSSEAHSLAVNVLKGLGNAHWVAVGLLAIANVLERFDNISTNDRECIDLLKDMLKLVKYLKLMRDLKVVFLKEVFDDMREAVQLVLSGAILCRSFIKSNKLSKFLLTKKIRDELVYLRGKVNSMKADLQGHVQLLIVKTLIFITGRHDENNCLEMTEQHHAMATECEMEQSCEAEIDRSEAANVSSEVQDICNEKDRYKKVEMTLRSFFQLGKFLRKIFPSRLGRQPKLALYLELRMMLKKIQPSQIDFNRSELNKATKGFSQKIGEGGSGSVYRGTLSDGRAVAVKTWNNKYYQYDEIGLMNELRILTKLQHRNIMQLVGYCSEEDLMLVYDFMPRDLGRIICGEDEIIIDWPTRRRIIMDIIRGLSYLHEGPDGCIVHRDIKPSNILLDENLNAKISDFGISRILEADNFKHVSEIYKHGGNAQYTNKEVSMDGADVLDKTHLTTNILGTAGYIDPEYFQTYRLTPKSDIYGFGVLLLNVVSGKRAIFHTQDEMCHLAPQARKLHKEDRLVELIDPRLMNRDGLVYWSSILRMIKIALYCIVLDSHMRPSASQLLKMLSSDNEMPILPLHLSSAGYGYNFSQEENCVPSPPMASIVAADHSSQENIPTHSPPVKSLVVEGHSSEENIPIASPPLKSVALNANCSLQKIRESDTKW